MNRLNPITEDYKLLLVFRNIGVQLLQRLKEVIGKPPYAPLFKERPATGKNEIGFSYLEHQFSTGIELFFEYSRMPRSAFIATYSLHPERGKDSEEIVRYSFDLDYTINGIYNLEDFAEYYLIDFHENLKKQFSDRHDPFPIRISDK
jgi:hypothetical protein